MDDQTWHWIRRGAMLLMIIMSIEIVKGLLKNLDEFTEEEIISLYPRSDESLISANEVMMEDIMVLTFHTHEKTSGWRDSKQFPKMTCLRGRCPVTPKQAECRIKGKDKEKKIKWSCKLEMNFFEGLVFGLYESSVICQQTQPDDARYVVEDSCMLPYSLQMIMFTSVMKLLLVAAIAYGIYEQIVLKVLTPRPEEEGMEMNYLERAFSMGQRSIPVVFMALYFSTTSGLSHVIALARDMQMPEDTNTLILS